MEVPIPIGVQRVEKRMEVLAAADLTMTAAEESELLQQQQQVQEELQAQQLDPSQPVVVSFLLMIRASKKKHKKLERVHVQLPCALLPNWVIPARCLPGVLGHLQQDQHARWKGRHMVDMPDLPEVLMDWDRGLYIPATESRIAPLRILQHPLLSSLWKYSIQELCSHTTPYQVLVYALHSRVVGLPRYSGDQEVHTPMSMREAMAELTQLQHSGRAGTVSPTLAKLSKLLSSQFNVTWYEKFVLGKSATHIFLLPSCDWGKLTRESWFQGTGGPGAQV
jgi:hypothetical protein